MSELFTLTEIAVLLDTDEEAARGVLPPARFAFHGRAVWPAGIVRKLLRRFVAERPFEELMNRN